MATHVATQQAIIVIGGYTDAGGYAFVPDGHGGWKRVPIPGNDPRTLKDIQASLSVLTAAARLSESSAGHALLNEAVSLASSNLSKLGGAGQSTVVVVAGA